MSVTSKVLEKVIHEQLYRHIVDVNLLYRFQSGFRSTYSTDSCLLHLTDFIRYETDAEKSCGMFLIDLQKAFNTVDHRMLLSMLFAIGLDPLALKWFVSYLSDRVQKTEIHAYLSKEQFVTHGVPQVSVLGSLLFLIYINVLKSACGENLFLYANDSAILVSHREESRLRAILVEKFNKVRAWLIDNK